MLFVGYIRTTMVQSAKKRVVIISWKDRKEICFEVFSNLRNLCLTYPEYNYNTLNNYLGKAKKAYENDSVRIERKNIITQPKQNDDAMNFERIVPVVRKVALKDADESGTDLDYWLKQTPQKRIAAATFIVSQSLGKGERMNKKAVRKQLMKV